MDIHHKLVEFVKAELGDLLVNASRGWETTLGEIWKSGRNVVFGYNSNQVVNNFPSTVFPSVQQRWGDKQNLDDLKKYFENAGHPLVYLLNFQEKKYQY